jgi:hypothetical protein
MLQRTTACIIVGFLCAFAGFVAGHVDDASGYENCKAIQKLAEIIGPGDKHYLTNYGNDAGCIPPKWYATLKPAEVLLVFVGFGTMLVIAWQSWETRKSSEAARITAVAQVNGERAWIDGKIAPKVQFSHLSRWLIVTNHGKTSAEIMSYIIQAGATPEALTPHWVFNDHLFFGPQTTEDLRELDLALLFQNYEDVAIGSSNGAVGVTINYIDLIVRELRQTEFVYSFNALTGELERLINYTKYS